LEGYSRSHIFQSLIRGIIAPNQWGLLNFTRDEMARISSYKSLVVDGFVVIS